jgi:hypothetical protein
MPRRPRAPGKQTTLFAPNMRFDQMLVLVQMSVDVTALSVNRLYCRTQSVWRY